MKRFKVQQIGQADPGGEFGGLNPALPQSDFTLTHLLASVLADEESLSSTDPVVLGIIFELWRQNTELTLLVQSCGLNADVALSRATVFARANGQMQEAIEEIRRLSGDTGS